MTLLAVCNTLTVYLAQKRTEVASWVRRTLGPEPQNWILLQDGRIVSSTIVLPSHVQESAYLYNISTNHLKKMDGEPTGRFRPLSILALQIQHTDVGSIDISDWIGDIRIFPQQDITPKQLVELWAVSQNQYVPNEDAYVVVTRNDGSIETIALV